MGRIVLDLCFWVDWTNRTGKNGLIYVKRNARDFDTLIESQTVRNEFNILPTHTSKFGQ